MSDEEVKKRVEAVIFSAGRAVLVEEIAKICQTSDGMVRELLKEIKNDYEERGSPLLIISEGDGWKITVKEGYLDFARQINPHTELDRSTLATLAVIAWKHPVLQSEVIKIRTTNAYEHIKTLVELGFVSKERYGRSFIVKVTGKFFDYFDLPDKKNLSEVFKDVNDFAEEIQQKIDDMKPKDEEEIKEGEEGEVKEGEGSTEQKELGGLPVYEVPPGERETEKKEVQHYDEEKFGKLEVFEEPKPEDLEEGEYSYEEEPEETSEETPKEGTEEGESEEEPAETEIPEPEEEEREIGTPRELPSELEDFAGEGEEKLGEEKEEEKEDIPEESPTEEEKEPEETEEEPGEKEEETEEKTEEGESEEEPDEGEEKKKPPIDELL